MATISRTFFLKITFPLLSKQEALSAPHSGVQDSGARVVKLQAAT